MVIVKLTNMETSLSSWKRTR